MRTSPSRLALALAAIVLAPAPLVAQQPAGLGAVRGVVYDSLAHRPLPGARVWTADGLRTTVADEDGRFTLDSVVAADGPIGVLAEHPAADSVGLPTLAAAVRVEAGRTAEVTVAIPSYATLRAAACRGLPDAGDAEGGVLFGVVRSAGSGLPEPGAVVTLSWLQFHGVSGPRGGNPADVVVQALDALTDGSGAFYACGVPTSGDVTMRATALLGDGAGATGAADTATSSEISVLVGERRILRRDVLVGLGGRAVVVAHVTADGGRPVRGANVYADADAPVLTNGAGQAVLDDVTPGTRVVTARSVGFTPVARAVDLADGDTARIELRVSDVPVELATVRVRAVRTLLEVERRTAASGYAITGERLARSPTLSSIFHQVPSIRIAGSGPSNTRLIARDRFAMIGDPWCDMSVYLDGRKSDLVELQIFAPDDLLAVEVYPSGVSAPLMYVRPVDMACGVVLVWLKK